MKFLIGSLIFIFASLASADIAVQMNLGSAVKVAVLPKEPMPLIIEEPKKAEPPPLSNCLSFHYAQNICTMVKSYLDSKRDQL